MTVSFLARKLFSRLREKNLVLVTAESLTGGMIGSTITAISGASTIYWGGIVAYSNVAKQSLLGVSEALIESKGPVSSEVACAMATGALSCCMRGIAIAVTGLAGPSGGTPELPVGSVWIAVARSPDAGNPVTLSQLYSFSGSRNNIRRKTVREAFRLALDLLDK